MSDKFVYLHSVGCYFDVKNILVYAYPPYHPCSEGIGTDVAECSDEWWSRLSPEDLDTVSNATNEYYGGGTPDDTDDAFGTYVANLNWN